jgi:16S rRNA (guanine966-N2)-methyltransferase
MPRIIGGARKGSRLKSPGGRSTRPTGARVRQSLFDVLAVKTHGCRFLDLFAGSGGVGLEAFSRGASRVVLVDRDRHAIAALRRNLLSINAMPGAVEIWRADYRSALARLDDARIRFDLVYLDPPYATAEYTELLERVVESGILAPDSIVIVEHFHKRVLPEKIGGLRRFRSVRVGDHRLSFFRPWTQEREERAN